MIGYINCKMYVLLECFSVDFYDALPFKAVSVIDTDYSCHIKAVEFV